MKKITKKYPNTKKVVTTKLKKNFWLNILVISNVIAFVLVLIVNYLAVSLPLGWMTTWALSDLYPNLFTPAWLTFSIWGIIYLWLLAFVVWQIVDFYKKKSNNITQKIWIWFVLSCLANIARMFAWQYQQVVLSIIIMFAFLIILSVIAHKLHLEKRLGSLWDKYLVQIPFSLYLWRISVATIANVAAVLVYFGRSMRGISDISWTILVIIVATLIALLSLKKTANIVFALVVVWAFVGIIIKRVDVDPSYSAGIIWVVVICIGVIATGIGLKFDQWRKN